MSSATSAVDAERAVLGCVLLGEWSDDVHEDLFVASSHRRIWTHLEAIHKAGSQPDVILLSSRLLAMDDAEREKCGGMGYAASLPAYVDTTAGWERYIRTCQDFAMRRSVREAAQELSAAAQDPTEDLTAILDRAERALSSLTPTTSMSTAAPLDAAQRAWELLERRMNARQQGKTVCVCTSGISALDDRLAPAMQAGALVVLAARPGMGKSAMALQWAVQTAKRQQGVLLFSLEMSIEQIVHRAWASIATVELDRFIRGDPNLAQTQKIEDAYGLLASMPLHICDEGGLTLGGIKSIVRRKRLEFDRAGTPLGLVVIDYLQLMSSDRKTSSREEAVANNSKGLKALAKECAAPVLMLSQLNRGVEQRPNKRPLMSDLRESGSIEQDADAVVFIYRDGYYRPDAQNPGETECIISKLRDGNPGTVTAQFQGEYARFLSMERRYAQ